MSSALATITDRVRERVKREGMELTDAVAHDLVRDEVQRYSERALGGSVPLLADEESTARQILATLTGFGALQPFLDDPEVEEIWLNSPDEIFIARGGRPQRSQLALTDTEVRDLVERMLQASGRRVDLSSPFVDASLPDGSRLHVVIPDVTRKHWAVNIRKFTRRIGSLHELVELGSLTRQAAEFLRMSVLAGCNIVVSGATQSGKTTMLNALLSSARPTERIITVEETFELDFAALDRVGMQCRQPSIEGSGEITLRRLIKESLRMRPDRLVVGEVREAESLDLLIALNSGLPGMSSIHANSARDALSKLCTLPLLAGRNIDSAFVVPTVAGCIDLIVHCELQRSGKRRVVEIVAPSGNVSGAMIEASTIFALLRPQSGAERNAGDLRATGSYPTRTAKFDLAGFDPAAILGASS
ncbi:MAG: CpaF family protein [Microbacteriaceae bacterium]